MWESIQYISGGATLTAFLCAIALSAYRISLKHALKNRVDIPRHDLVNYLLTKAGAFDPNVGTLSETQRYRLARQQISDRMRRFQMIARAAFIVAICLVVVTAYAISRSHQQKDFLTQINRLEEAVTQLSIEIDKERVNRSEVETLVGEVERLVNLVETSPEQLNEEHKGLISTALYLRSEATKTFELDSESREKDHGLDKGARDNVSRSLGSGESQYGEEENNSRQKATESPSEQRSAKSSRDGPAAIIQGNKKVESSGGSERAADHNLPPILSSEWPLDFPPSAKFIIDEVPVYCPNERGLVWHYSTPAIKQIGWAAEEPAPVIVVNSQLLRQLPRPIQMFWYGHECAYHVLGFDIDPSAADCWAVETALTQGLVQIGEVEFLVEFMQSSQLFTQSDIQYIWNKIPTEEVERNERATNLRECVAEFLEQGHVHLE